MSVTAVDSLTAPSRNGGRLIRPPDAAIVGPTLAYMPIASHEATRRLAHLAFRDAGSVLDLTYAHGGFWRDPLPPGLRVTTNNLDPASGADLHPDFTRTGLPDGVFDLVIYDPPHVADGGHGSIMARRFGTVRGTPALRELIVAGALEAWRVSAVGVIVKLADHAHGGEWLSLSDWVKQAMPAYPGQVALEQALDILRADVGVALDTLAINLSPAIGHVLAAQVVADLRTTLPDNVTRAVAGRLLVRSREGR